MKRMKLRFTALALLACFSLGLTACGGNGGGSAARLLPRQRFRRKLPRRMLLPGRPLPKNRRKA